jgi:hypothetical protein
MALRQLGNVNPSNTERANAVIYLNSLLKRLDPKADWKWTWVYTPGSITTVANQRSYTVAADSLASNIYRIEHVDKVVGTTLSPITVIDTYERLSSVDREGTGEPQWAFLQTAPVLANQKLDFLPTPDAAYTYQYTYRRRLYDFTAATDNPDFPGEWILSLATMLASLLSREYGMQLQERLDLKNEASQFELEMLAANGDTDKYIPPQYSLYY